jgi:hypothetical protein
MKAQSISTGASGRSGKWFLPGLAAAFAAVLVPASFGAQDYDPQSRDLARAPIIVEGVKGDVKATTPNNKTPFALKNGAKLTQGSSITTGKKSRAILLFTNGAAVSLGPNTSLVINEFMQAGGYDLAEAPEEGSGPPSAGSGFNKIEKEPSWSRTNLFFRTGSIVTKVRKLDKKSQFLVGSPLGVTKVRGTTFRQTNGSNGETLTKEITIELQEGSLEFDPVDTPDGENPPVTIQPGQQIRVTGTFQSLADMGQADSMTTVSISIVVTFNMSVTMQQSQINDPNFLAAVAQALPPEVQDNYNLLGLALADAALDTSPFFTGDQGVGNVGGFGFGGSGGGSPSGGGGGEPTPTPTPVPPTPTPQPPT